MIFKLLYLPVRFIHAFSVIAIAVSQYVFAKIFKSRDLDLGLFYQKNLERLGGTFIKIGQVLSVRYDILPEEQCKALAKLQDNVKAFDSQKGIQIINSELGGFENHNLTIAPQPFAAGSLCQVYRASNDNGQTFAIKVKRPFIDSKMYADTLFLKMVKYILLLLGIGKKIGVGKLIDEVIEVLRKELDYKNEIKHLELFFPIEQRVDGLVVPKVYPNLCSEKILTMDYLEGIPLSEYIAQLPEQRVHDPNTLCIRIYDIYLQCIFREGIFHADAHPGNIFILEDGKIGLVDFGIVGVLNSKMRQKNYNYLLALSEGQTETAAEIFAGILNSNHDSDKNALLIEIRIELELYLKRLDDPDSGLSEKSSAALYTHSMALARKYNFTFPQNVFLFYKTMFTLDSVLLKLDPQFDSKTHTGLILHELTKDKIINALSFNQVMSKINEVPEILASIPEIFSMAKTLLEENTKRRKQQHGTIAATIIRGLGFFSIFAAIIFPFLHFTEIIHIESLSNIQIGLISMCILFIGIRLKN